MMDSVAIPNEPPAEGVIRALHDDSSDVAVLQKKLEMCQRAGRAALLAARLQIIDLQGQLVDKIAANPDMLQIPGAETTPTVQALQRTVQHLQLDLESQMQKRHGVDEERIRQEQGIEEYKGRIQDLEDQLEYANQKIKHLELDATDGVHISPAAIAERDLREKIEKRNKKLQQKLSKATAAVNNQQMQIRRYDRELHLCSQREINLQRLLTEEKDKYTQMNMTMTMRSIKSDVSSQPGFRGSPVRSKSDARLPKFASYGQEPPRH